MLLAAAATTAGAGAKSDTRPHYLRIAKTGSGTALDYFGTTGCSRQLQVHDSHWAFAHHYPPPARSVAVVREPCDRAASMLAHMFNGYSAGRTWFLYHFRDHSLNLSAATTLLELANFVNRSGVAVTRTTGGHVDIFYAQFRYVGPCTQVICLNGLESALQRICQSTQRITHSVHVQESRVGSSPVNGSSPGCAAVRAVYQRDWDIYRQHCVPLADQEGSKTLQAPAPLQSPPAPRPVLCAAPSKGFGSSSSSASPPVARSASTRAG